MKAEREKSIQILLWYQFSHLDMVSNLKFDVSLSLFQFKIKLFMPYNYIHYSVRKYMQWYHVDRLQYPKMLMAKYQRNLLQKMYSQFEAIQFYVSMLYTEVEQT